MLFGVSVDYHIFILRERRLAGATTREAVVGGIAAGAAVVMRAVFTVFITLSAIENKLMGVGMAVLPRPHLTSTTTHRPGTFSAEPPACGRLARSISSTRHLRRALTQLDDVLDGPGGARFQAACGAKVTRESPSSMARFRVPSGALARRRSSGRVGTVSPPSIPTDQHHLPRTLPPCRARASLPRWFP